MDRKQHWEKVYQTKSAETVSWFQPQAQTSLRLIQNTGAEKTASIIDVGGGASTLVDGLLDDGYLDVSVLDLSGEALSVAKKRLGKKAKRVTWIEGDITNAPLPRHRYDIWHDRAVFHFLTELKDRQAYVDQVLKSVRPGGHVIVASFAEDGPEKCSGLDVVRYSPDGLHSQFGGAFRLLGHERETHRTPAGKEQLFVYCYCRMENN
ncbi:MAG: class I SAM-dependent methyltransferase [Alphaproteobacteria bacterium]|nr:class I SAM-dependent methyltransferase [Alphaproteobacteria bacterium]